MAAAIHEKAPDAVLLAVKVFDRSLSSSAAALVATIDWAVGRRVQLVNLSLGTTDAVHEPAWTSRCARQLGSIRVPPDHRPGSLRRSASFAQQMDRLVELCRTTPVAPGQPQVRLPGQAALERRARQLQDGVALHARILPALATWAMRFGLPVPAPIATER